MEFVKSFIDTYGMLAIFIIVMIEYACFPLPSEIVLPLAGALAVSKGTSLFIIILLTVIAGMIGALICYSIGYYGGNPLIMKIKDKYKKTAKGIDYSIEKYHKYENVAVSVGRIIPLCRTYVSFIAGAARQNIFKYMFLTMLGVVVWNSVLVGLGFVFYDNLSIISDFYNEYKLICLIIVGIIVVAFIIVLLIKKKFKK